MRPAAGAFVGLSTLDIVYRVAEPPGPGRKVVADRQEIAAGGPAANAAVTFAALDRAAGGPQPGGPQPGGPQPGGPQAGMVTLVTALGRHPLAGEVAAELVSRGVAVLDAAPDRTGPPAVSSACVRADDGERSVVSVNAGGVEAAPPAGLAAAVRAAAVLLVDGHHPRLAVAAAAEARATGRLVLLDGGSWKPVLDELLPLVDIAVCSADFRVPGAGSAAQAVAALPRRWGVPAAALTAGAAPVRWWHPDAGPGGEVIVPTATVRDTLGAGDAFHGALAWALAAADRPGPRPDPAGFAAALGFAAGVAAVRCETFGPRGWLADPRLAGYVAGWLARRTP